MRYEHFNMRDHGFAGHLVIDVVNKRYAGIKYPKFMAFEIYW